MAAILGFLAAAGRSSAQTTVSYSFGLPLTLTTTELNVTGDLGFFDSDLGTLTSIVLTLQEAYTSSGSLTYTGAANNNVRMRINMEYNWGSSVPEVDSLVNTTQLYTTLDSGSLPYTPGQTRNFTGTSASHSRDIDLTSLIPQLQQSGGGTFGMSLGTFTGSQINGGGGNAIPSIAAQAAVGATITYTYTPVPETSIGLLTLAGGLALVARRARS